MKTHPYLIIKQGDQELAIFIEQIGSFHSDGTDRTIVFLIDGTNRTLDIGFDSFCRMINAETKLDPEPDNAS